MPWASLLPKAGLGSRESARKAWSQRRLAQQKRLLLHLVAWALAAQKPSLARAPDTLSRAALGTSISVPTRRKGPRRERGNVRRGRRALKWAGGRR